MDNKIIELLPDPKHDRVIKEIKPPPQKEFTMSHLLEESTIK